MVISRSLIACTSLVLLVLSAEAAAQNGKPFRQIQSQFAQVDEELAALEARVRALEARVAGVEGSLQAQIAILNANLTTLRERITTVESAVATLEATVGANTTAIGALENAIADLKDALAIANNDIAANAGDVLTLKGQVSTITALINTHVSQIGSLQQQNAMIGQFLTNLADGTCQTGAAISDVDSTGLISCTTASGGAGSVATHSTTVMGTLNFGSNTLIVSCRTGYALASSGYTAPSNFEGYAYLKPGGTTGVSYKSPVSVTADFAFNGTALVTLSYTPDLFFAGNTWAAVANCVKVS